MTKIAQDYIADFFDRSVAALQNASENHSLQACILQIADLIGRALQNGNKLLIAGNGGSAADAQHLAGEFLSRYQHDRRPLPAIALTTDTSVLTAIGNDYGFESIFERQVLGLGRAGDVFLAISTSGRSANVLAALRAARGNGLKTIGFSGASGGTMRECCDLLLAAPSEDTPIIQQIHIVAGHAICGLIEGALRT